VLPIARAVENAFEHDNFHVVLWTHDVFTVANYPIEDLERELEVADFAIAVAQPDDLVKARKDLRFAPRDNVIFELGFSWGGSVERVPFSWSREARMSSCPRTSQASRRSPTSLQRATVSQRRWVLHATVYAITSIGLGHTMAEKNELPRILQLQYRIWQMSVFR
jgi:hypothetical protein